MEDVRYNIIRTKATVGLEQQDTGIAPGYSRKSVLKWLREDCLDITRGDKPLIEGLGLPHNWLKHD
jgi:hypothetical protein